MTRRRFAEIAGLGATAALAGCVDEVDDLTGGAVQPLEILHGWAEGDGATAVRALIESFGETAPDVDTEFTAIEGGSNENLDTVVDYRLQDGDPPGSFANWPGKNLQRYEGALGSIDDVWDENDFADRHVDEAVDLHRQNGSFRGVPVGSHRLNNLFYNVEILEEAGVDPDGITSLDALFDAMNAVDAETDAAPMTHAMSAPWPTTQLWVAVVLGQEGYESYVNFIEGNGSAAAVSASFETTARILAEYITYDARSLGMTGSNNKVINGEAAFIHQGNWTAGAFANATDFEYGEHWGATAFPGTENMYTLHFDSFLYPGDNPTPERSRRWLEFVGSETAQVAFNQHKGSIPTLTDVDMSEFNRYLQQVAEDFENAEYRPPTLQHGLALAPEKVASLNTIVANSFMGPYDVDGATSGFLDVV